MSGTADAIRDREEAKRPKPVKKAKKVEPEKKVEDGRTADWG